MKRFYIIGFLTLMACDTLAQSGIKLASLHAGAMSLQAHGMLGVARLVHVESHDPQVKKRMELIESTGTHLLGLVTDLIDVPGVIRGADPTFFEPARSV